MRIITTILTLGLLLLAGPFANAASQISVVGNLDFGNVTVGQRISIQATITNDGDQSFTVSGIEAPSGYSVEPFTGEVAPTTSETILVMFEPTAESEFSGTLSVISDAAQGTGEASCTGTGVSSNLGVSTRVISDSTVSILVQPGTEVTAYGVEEILPEGLTPANISPSSGVWNSTQRTLSWVFMDGEDRTLSYTISGTPSTPLLQGTTIFGVTEVAVGGASLLQESGDTGDSFSLSGDLAYGTVIVGQSQTATLTISNTGDASMTVNSVSYPDGFSGLNWTGDIAAGASQDVTVTFSPTATIEYSGQISVSAGAPEMVKQIACTGTGGAEEDIGLAERQIVNNQVTLSLLPPEGTTAVGAEETVPEGLTPESISNGGVWDENNRKISWVFMDGEDRQLSYVVNGLTGQYTLTGIAIFGVTELSIQGDTLLAYDSTDTDGDGLNDEDEQKIVDADPDDDINSVADVNGQDDFDGDGFTNLEEIEEGTDATLADDYPRTKFTPSELVLYDRTTQTWSVYWIATAEEKSFVWGSENGTPVPADYDGDGYLDAATYEGKTGQWDILYSNGGNESLTWGWKGGVAVPADFTGDGKADLGFYAPDSGEWYVYDLHTETSSTLAYGWNGCTPSIGDFDGDGVSDKAVYDTLNSHWYTYQSSSNSAVSMDLGVEGAFPVPGDFNGDGISDPTVFYPPTGTWYIHSSAGGDSSLVWGWNEGCFPLTGDFDGDGADDLAVFDYQIGRWNIYYTGTGQSLQVDWTGQGGVPASSPRFGQHDSH